MGFVGMILVFLFFKLGNNDKDEQKHYLLQLLLLFFILSIVVLIGKVGLDYKNPCAWLVANDTVSGNTTSYTYTYECGVESNTTAEKFYNLTVWVMRIVATYVCLYFLWELLVFFGLIGKKGDGT